MIDRALIVGLSAAGLASCGALLWMLRQRWHALKWAALSVCAFLMEYILAGGALFCGGLVLFLAVTAVAMIGLFELFRALGLRKTALEAAGFMGAALFLEAVWLGWDKGLMLALFLSLMLILGTYVFTWPKYTASQAAETAFAVLYVPVLLSYVYRTDLLTESIVYTALTLLAAWCSDVGAYCMGMLFGKHKLTPELSPKKTVEGAVGAVLFA